VSLIICRLLQAYIIILFARIILSWFPLSPGGGMSTVYGFLHTLTEPVLAPLRRLIPPIGMGGMGLDLSPLIVFFGISLLLRVVC
jgi:YggT family protein